MDQAPLQSGWDALLFAIPSIGLLLAGFLRLDRHLATPKHGIAKRSSALIIDKDGHMLFTDPDGRPWPRKR